MSKRKFLILSENSVLETGWLTETIEEAREIAKNRASEFTGKKYFIMESTEYGICEVKPCTFFTPDYIVDLDKVEQARNEATPDRPRGRIRNMPTEVWLAPDQLYGNEPTQAPNDGTQAGRIRYNQVEAFTNTAPGFVTQGNGYPEVPF